MRYCFAPDISLRVVTMHVHVWKGEECVEKKETAHNNRKYLYLTSFI